MHIGPIIIHPSEEDHMQKMKLELERLEVTSFETVTEKDERGTVAAYDLSGLSCPCQSYPTRYTCCTPLA
jgi:hypothetical protein